MPSPQPGEVRVRLAAADELAVRVAISPMPTVLSSIFEALLGAPRGAPESWYRYVRERAGDTVDVFRPVYTRVFPDFVAPNPIAPRATFQQELDAMRAFPAELIIPIVKRMFGDDPPPGYRRFLRDPREALNELVNALGEYWSRVFESQWATMEAILEREVLTLGRRMVADGAGALLARLHPRIALEDGVLRWTSAAMKQECELTHGRLLVVPMLSGPDAILSSITEKSGAVIAYAAPGTSLLWERADAAADDGLTRVLGATQARVMLAVTTPATTADVAHQLGLSAALSSHHLKALERKGLVDGVRFGRRVYYRLTVRGQRMRDALAA
jgi:DNA-binding transcriptional ArsR family regulator